MASAGGHAGPADVGPVQRHEHFAGHAEPGLKPTANGTLAGAGRAGRRAPATVPLRPGLGPFHPGLCVAAGAAGAGRPVVAPVCTLSLLLTTLDGTQAVLKSLRDKRRRSWHPLRRWMPQAVAHGHQAVASAPRSGRTPERRRNSGPAPAGVARAGVVSHGALQGCLEHRLIGCQAYLSASLVSNAVFSISHQHRVPDYAQVVFVLGLVWGWMYHRHQSPLGVSLPDILIGLGMPGALDRLSLVVR